MPKTFKVVRLGWMKFVVTFNIFKRFEKIIFHISTANSKTELILVYEETIYYICVAVARSMCIV